MTETEWLNSTDPENMVLSLADLRRKDALQQVVTERKVRLLMIALWRHLSNWDTTGPTATATAAIRNAEQYAEGEYDEDPERLFRLGSSLLQGHGCEWFAAFAAGRDPFRGLVEVAPTLRRMCMIDLSERSARIIREVIGNPWRKKRATTSWLQWREETVPRLAATVYSTRDWAALPLVADALEEAGCDDAEILAHLRNTGPHVRGCWALDLALSRG